MGRPFYFAETGYVAQSYLSSYQGYYSSWDSVFPQQWDYSVDTFKQLGMYVGPDMGQWTPEVQQELYRHVVEYRENYTDFPISAIRMAQQHRDWIHGNWTFMYADFGVFLVEFDSALKMADIILAGRPECGMSDRQLFISEAAQNLTTVLSTTFEYMMSSNSYMYNIVNQQVMDSFQSMFSMAIMDMYDPLRAIQQLELNFFETNRALIRKQLDNLSRALSWYINSGLLVTLTNQRDWLLDMVQNVDSRLCQYPDQ